MLGLKAWLSRIGPGLQEGQRVGVMLSFRWHSPANTAMFIHKIKQPLIAKWLFLKNAVVEAAGIEPASASTLQTVLHT